MSKRLTFHNISVSFEEGVAPGGPKAQLLRLLQELERTAALHMPDYDVTLWDNPDGVEIEQEQDKADTKAEAPPYGPCHTPQVVIMSKDGTAWERYKDLRWDSLALAQEGVQAVNTLLMRDGLMESHQFEFVGEKFWEKHKMPYA